MGKHTQNPVPSHTKIRLTPLGEIVKDVLCLCICLAGIFCLPLIAAILGGGA